MSLRPGPRTLGIGFLAILAAIPHPVCAQPEQYEGRLIRTIQFVPREQPMEAGEIFRLLPLKTGQPLRLDDIRTSIEKLYATGHYIDIQVDAALYNEEVVIRFLTQPSWFIGLVSVRSNTGDPPNTGQLVNATRLQLGEAYSAEKVLRAMDGIQQTLEANGYHESRVSPSYEYDARTQQIHINFVVDGESRSHYAEPEVAGDPKLPESRIVGATKWKGWFGWRPVSQSRTQRGVEGIRRLYEKQDRLMASVSLDSITYQPESERDKPKLNLQAGPIVQVNTIGAKVSRSVLRRLVPVFEERTVDRDLLEEGKRNLRDYFQSEGYFSAEVEFKQQRVINDRANIDYLINLGRRHRLEEIEIHGNQYFDLETVRERMYLLPANFQFRRGRYSDAYRRRDEATIESLYRENGFRDVKVTSKVVDDYRGKRDDIAVIVNIDEGPQYFVSTLNMVGVNQLDEASLRSILASAAGQPFSEFNVAIDRDNILARYYSEGFSDAIFSWSADPAGEPNRVNLTYTLQEGRRTFVRQVLVSGLETTQPSLVNRNLSLNPGDPLSQIQMGETQRRLYDLGIFARVNMAVQNPEGDTEYKYVLYQMEEANRYSLSGGIGAEIARIGGSQTSLDNPAGSAGFSPRLSLNVGRLNFRGLGHTVSVRTRVSNLQQRALFSYSAPRFRDNPDLNLLFSALFDNSNDVRTFSARRREGSVQLSQRASKSDTLLYRFSYRRVSVNNLKIDPLVVPLLAQPVRIGMLSANFIRDRRDDPTDAHRGAYNTFDFGYASNIFGSEDTFARFLMRNSTYHEIGKRLVFARSLSFGMMSGFQLGQADDIPLPERFFSGGASSHRGFPDNQAGPRDTLTGFPLGGRALLMNNLELRFPLRGENLGAVLFLDSGNVYTELGDISFRFHQRDEFDYDYAVQATGLGIRYRTPIGPLRLDLAYSLNSPRFFGCTNTNPLEGCGAAKVQRIRPFQFHFSIGQTF